MRDMEYEVNPQTNTVMGPQVIAATGSIPPDDGKDRDREMEMAYPDPPIIVYVSQDPEKYYIEHSTVKRIFAKLGEQKLIEMGLPVPSNNPYKGFGNQNEFKLHEIDLNALRMLTKEFDVDYELLQNNYKSNDHDKFNNLNSIPSDEFEKYRESNHK